MKKNRKQKGRETSPIMDVITFKKLFMMVRFTLFCFFISIVQIMAVESYSQNTRLSVNMKNESLEKVLKQIEDKSEFFFLYNKDLIDIEQKVDIVIAKEDLHNKKGPSYVFADAGVECNITADDDLSIIIDGFRA